MHSCKGALAESREIKGVTLTNRTKQKSDRGQRGLWVRLLVLVTVAFTFASQSSSFAHFLLVEHAVCPEHGDWIHADELAAHTANSSEAAQHEGTSTGWTTLPLEDSHEHEHCAVSSERRHQLVVQANSAVLSPPPRFVQAAVGPPRTRVVRPVPLFRLAPKNSPPA
jgi:hypothetical protein